MKRNSGLFLTVCKKNAKKYFNLFVCFKKRLYLCIVKSKIGCVSDIKIASFFVLFSTCTIFAPLNEKV